MGVTCWHQVWVSSIGMTRQLASKILLSWVMPQRVRNDLIQLLCRICETPAPTFAEGARATLIQNLFQDAGVTSRQDEVGNVIAEIPGTTDPGGIDSGTTGQRVVLAAHLDTVFDEATPIHVKRNGNTLNAPGIGDNSASLAVLMQFVREVLEEDLPRPQLTIVATVGEEGLGNLRGARHLVETYPMDAFVAVDGYLGVIINRSVGSKRYKVTFRGSGGHAWGDFPSPSATHALGSAVHALGELSFSYEPRWSWNVGLIEGGTSINTIAETAALYLDLRSIDATRLEQLDVDAKKRLVSAAQRHDVNVETELIGSRPCAEVANQPLVQAAQSALSSVRIPPHLAASSTDANVAMAAGIPAITLGVYKGGHAHRLSEWVDPASLPVGVDVLKAFVAALVQH